MGQAAKEAGVSKSKVLAGDININIYPEKWSASGSYGEKASQRLTEDEWETFNGICGHEHVPNNTHWDPGAFDIKEFMGLVGSTRSTRDTVTPDDPPTDALQLFHVGDSDARVQLICGIVQALGYAELPSSDLYDSDVAAAVENLQKALGGTADGIWGPKTHALARAELDARLDWYEN